MCVNKFSRLCAIGILSLTAVCFSSCGSAKEASAPEHSSAIIQESAPNPSDTTEDEQPQFLSVILSYTVDGIITEKIYTDSKTIDKIADLILDQKPLEGLEQIPAPDNPITVTMQDWPGTNFKLLLYQAAISDLGKEVSIIQGELFSFYTDAQAYDDILQLLLG